MNNRVWMFWEEETEPNPHVRCQPQPVWAKLTTAMVQYMMPDRVTVLNRESFERDWWQDDRENLSLDGWSPMAMSDFIRAYLLKAHGGLWLDTDVFILKPLEPILEMLQTYASDFIAYAMPGNSGKYWQTALVASRAGSSIATMWYERQIELLQNRHRSADGSITGPRLLSECIRKVQKEDPEQFHCLSFRQVHPVPWGQPSMDFFWAERDDDEHEKYVHEDALCYNLTHPVFDEVWDWDVDRWKTSRTFAAYLFRRGLFKEDA